MKLPNPWLLGWKLGNGIANKIDCGTWKTCHAS